MTLLKTICDIIKNSHKKCVYYNNITVVLLIALEVLTHPMFELDKIFVCDKT